MGVLWITHGQLFETHGQPLETHGQPMSYPWATHDQALNLSCAAQGLSMGYPYLIGYPWLPTSSSTADLGCVESAQVRHVAE